MILPGFDPSPEDFERRTGWRVTPEGACKGDRCVPLSRTGDTIDVRAFAERLSMPLVHDEKHGAWSLGPESGGHALASARMPALVLPDLDGRPFDLASLHGRKVLLVAWASW